jgi:formamidopyrimidine-DNA glycosylase
MPELAEVDAYRRLATQALGRRVAAVVAPDAWYLRGGLDAAALNDALVGRRFVDARRIGKLLLLDTDGDGPVLGLRFGMTGRLIVDGVAAMSDLEYGSKRDLGAWDRVALAFQGGGLLRLNDPRRLGGAELDPDESGLGPDAFSLTEGQLRKALAGSEVAVKARIMDQRQIAGLGNLLVDEILYRAGVDPARPARSFDRPAVARLHRYLRRTLADLLAKGGSHLGDLQAARVRGGTCPRDGAPLLRRTIGGRTTYSCPEHQS